MQIAKKFRLNYLIIPLITIATALAGGYFTSAGMSWYNQTLIRPTVVPPSWTFPIAWNIIFVLTTISALIVYNRLKKGSLRTFALILFAANAILNVLWCYLFFGKALIAASFIEMLVLELTLLTLHTILWSKNRTASLLLLPYTLWIVFATFLTWQILVLN